MYRSRTAGHREWTHFVTVTAWCLPTLCLLWSHYRRAAALNAAPALRHDVIITTGLSLATVTDSRQDVSRRLRFRFFFLLPSTRLTFVKQRRIVLPLSTVRYVHFAHFAAIVLIEPLNLTLSLSLFPPSPPPPLTTPTLIIHGLFHNLLESRQRFTLLLVSAGRVW